MLWIRWRGGSTAFALLTAFWLLQFGEFMVHFSFMRLDHHFLEAFFLWTWLMSGDMFARGEKPPKGWALAGGVAWLGLMTAWSGMSRVAFLLVPFAMVMYLWGKPWAGRFGEFVSSTFLISAGLNMLLLIRMGETRTTALTFSWFQPLLVGALGLGMHFWHVLYTAGRWRLLASFLLGSGAIFWWGFGQVVTTALIHYSAGNPFFDTIQELQPVLSSNPANWNLLRTFELWGWEWLLYPLGMYLAWKSVLHREGEILHLPGIFIFFLSLFQVRYRRWLGVFAALWKALLVMMVFLGLHHMWKRTAPRTRIVLSLAILLPFPLFSGLYTLQFLSTRTVPSFAQPMVDAALWMRYKTPDPGGFLDDSEPSYGVMNFWDQGNLIAYYGRRPSVANNLIIGLDTMARFYSAASEDEVYPLCRDQQIKYWFVTKMSGEFFRTTLPHLLNTEFSGGGIRHDQRGIDWGKFPQIDFRKTFYGSLFWGFGLGGGGEKGSSHFRMVYVSPPDPEDTYPIVRIFEAVEGARLRGKAPPGEKVLISLPIELVKHRVTQMPYTTWTTANASGEFEVRVPYPTDDVSDEIKTGPSYMVSLEKTGEPVLPTAVKVSIDEIRQGSVVLLSRD